MHDPQEGAPAISLIIATVERAHELERLLSSIERQSFKSIEVIVVDQNLDDRITTAIERQRTSLRCTHIRSARGLSRARNAGILLASGTVIGFPDDDCWYPGELLRQVTDWFDQHPGYDLLCCPSLDEHGREVASRWPTKSAVVNRKTVLRACASSSMFLRRTVIDDIGNFDERLGLGAPTPFQSGEDSDLALRCVAGGHKGWFEKQFYIHHPRKGAGGDSSNSRAFAYGMGFGCFLRKHGYSVQTLIYHVLRALGGVVKSLLLARPKRATFFWKSALGRLQGYLMPGVSRQTTKT